MSRRRTTNFGIPADLAEIADFILDELPGMGFSSRTDVLKAAMREFCLRLIDRQVLPPNVFIEGMAKSRKPARTKARETSAAVGQEA